MRTVFVVNRGGHDFSDAERFGKLDYLSEGSIERYSIVNMYRKFSEKLRNSHEDDYILLTGLSTMQSVACSMFSFLHGQLNLLLYRDGRYIDRKVIMRELLEEDA